MFDEIDTLFALRELGTMGNVAARLRITQSAVSKRLQSLEARVGTPLLETVGRRVRLTPTAEDLLLRARPLLAELKACLTEHGHEVTNPRPLRVGVSESLLSSTGPRALALVLRKLPGLSLELHAHRSPVIVEQVRSGNYALGVCAETAAPKELGSAPLGREAMVLIPSSLGKFRWERGKEVKILAIEPSSATWSGLSSQLVAFERATRIRLVVTQTLESFTSLAQLAKAGFGHALVPRGIAEAMGVSRQALPLPGPGLSRELSLIGRTSLLRQEHVRRLATTLRRELGTHASAPRFPLAQDPRFVRTS